MSVDMREAVREAAQQPQHPLDVGEVYRRGRRRRLLRISAIAAAVVAVAGGVLFGGLQLAATRTSPVVGEGPPAEESVRVVQQLGAPGGVRILVVETPEGLCLRFGVEAEYGASCDLDRQPDAVTGAATVLPDADDGNGVFAGRLPDVVTSLTLARDGNTTTAETTDTDAGRFFIATDLNVGEYQLTAHTADQSVYVSGTIDVTRAGTSGVFFIPDSLTEHQTIQMLDVTGLPEQEAVSQVESTGLDALVVYQAVPAQAQVGLVIDQDPQPGTATDVPTEVTLVVGAAPRDHDIDGTLDCENDLRFEQDWEREAGAQGASTPEQALREALRSFSDDADGARIVMVDDNQGSVVVEGREVVTAVASEHERGWFVMRATGCSDGWQDT